MKFYFILILVISFIFLLVYTILTLGVDFWFTTFDYMNNFEGVTYPIEKSTHQFNSSCRLNKQKYSDAILVESIANNHLRYVGGTGHWFHMAEHVMPYLNLSLNLNHSTHRQSDILYIIFQEEYAVQNLAPFVRLLLTTIFAKDSHKEIHFGWTKQVNYNSKETTLDIKLIRDVNITFVVDFKTQDIQSLFIKDANNEGKYYSKHLLKNICVQRVIDFTWTYPRNRRGWLTTSQEYNYFHSRVTHSCGLNSASPYHRVVSSLGTSKNRSMSKNQILITSNLTSHMSPLSIDDAYVWRDRGTLQMPPSPVVIGAPRNVLIYQRDKTRSLREIDTTVKVLNKMINQNIPITSNRWDIQVLTHSDKYSPCEIISKINKATVLFTPHGFQSILTLFQPKASVLIEIHPYMYFMPFYFGTIPSSLRRYLGHPRSYLAEESVSNSFLLSTLLALRLVDSKTCGQSSLCRYVARLQDVTVSTYFLERVSKYLNEHFI